MPTGRGRRTRRGTWPGRGRRTATSARPPEISRRV